MWYKVKIVYCLKVKFADSIATGMTVINDFLLLA